MAKEEKLEKTDVEKKPSAKEVTGKESFNKRRIIIGVVVIVLAIVLVVVLIPLFSRRENTYRVLVAKTTISKGLQITKENCETYLAVGTTTDINVARTGYQSADAMFGLYIKTDVVEGNIVTKSVTTDKSVLSVDRVPDGKELGDMDLVSIVTAVGFMPKAGDIIRVYGVKTNEVPYIDRYGIRTIRTEPQAFVYSLLQYVEIYSVLDSAGASVTKSNNTPTNVVLVLTTAQAKQLKEAMSSGNYYLTLVSSGDPLEADRLLSYQSRYCDAYEAMQNLGDNIPTESYSISLEKFNLTNYYPMPGDVVQISYAAQTEKQKVGADGKITTSKVTELVNSKMIPYALIEDVTDAGGKTVSLGTSVDEEPTKDYQKNYKKYNISLSLTEEQLAELSELIQNGNVFLTKVSDKETEGYETYLETTASAARAAKIEKILNGLSEQSEE